MFLNRKANNSYTEYAATRTMQYFQEIDELCNKHEKETIQEAARRLECDLKDEQGNIIAQEDSIRGAMIRSTIRILKSKL